MSYDLGLVDPETKETLELPEKHDLRGGTYVVGGSREASLNVTYNYGKHFRNVFQGDDGLRSLYGMTGAESVPILEECISKLGDDVSSDYWEATEGNAKAALKNLLTLAKACPKGVWEGD